MDCVCAGLLRGIDDLLDYEVRLGRGARADVYGRIGVTHVERVTVGVRVDGDGLDAEFAASALDAQCDLATIGEQYSFQHAARTSGV